MPCELASETYELDIASLKERYEAERNKRLRPDGENQYLEVSHDFASYYEEDPYAPRISRDPISTIVDVAVIGGGFAGMMAGAQLVQRGITNFRIIDMAGDFGGTWYWNRYPGVQCDVESYCYLPFLEELGYLPKERYSYGPEIFEHCQRIGQHFGLYEKALFGTMVRALLWDESTKCWSIVTNRGDDLHARFVILASGPYNRPKLPGIPGIEKFKGRTFHTSRWDYDYTGGREDGALVNLADKRVAIVGTGSTAIQCIPFLAKYSKHLYVLQRTPSAVAERLNTLTDPDFANSLEPGWQRRRQANFHQSAYYGVGPGQQDLVCDGWTEIGRRIAAKREVGEKDYNPGELAELRENEDHQMMEKLRRRVDEIIEDRETAEKLKAYYRFGCKRPTFHDEYLPTFNRANVTLVDVSSTRGVEGVGEKGIIADGRELAVDCIIFASGFEVTSEIKRRIGIERIEGRNGVSLYDQWKDGFKTLHGFTTHGFPNIFFTGFTQGGTSAAISAMYDEQTRHIGYIIEQALSRNAEIVEPKEEAQAAWVQTMRDTEVQTFAFFTDCTPSYYNNEGGTEMRSLGETYGPGFEAFVSLLEEWRNTGELKGLELSQAPKPGRI